MFAGTSSGVVRAVKFPLGETGEWQEYQAHNGPISKVWVLSKRELFHMHVQYFTYTYICTLLHNVYLHTYISINTRMSTHNIHTYVHCAHLMCIIICE